MKKIIILSSLILVAAVFVGCGKTGNQNSNGGITQSSAETVLDKIFNEPDPVSQAKSETTLGSCTDSKDSTCTEYYGSLWTENTMRMACDGERKLSSDPCPSGAAGACEIGVDQELDAATWLYFSDEAGVTSDSIGYAKIACEATMGAKWLNGR